MKKEKPKKLYLEGSKLRLMIFDSAKELGDKIDAHLVRMYDRNPAYYTFKVPLKENFFQDGHQKIEIQDTVRGKDLYMIGKELVL